MPARDPYRETVREQILNVLRLHGPKKRNPLAALLQVDGETVDGVVVSQCLQVLKHQGEVERGSRGWQLVTKDRRIIDEIAGRFHGTQTGRFRSGQEDTMQEFASTRNGQIFLNNVARIATALTTLAEYVEGQAAKEKEDVKFKLLEKLATDGNEGGPTIFYRIVKMVEKGEEAYGLSPNETFNDQVRDYLHRLEIAYWIWPHANTSGRGDVYLNRSQKWIAGREPQETDFNSPEEYNAAREEAVGWLPTK